MTVTRSSGIVAGKSAMTDRTVSWMRNAITIVVAKAFNDIRPALNRFFFERILVNHTPREPLEMVITIFYTNVPEKIFPSLSEDNLLYS